MRNGQSSQILCGFLAHLLQFLLKQLLCLPLLLLFSLLLLQCRAQCLVVSVQAVHGLCGRSRRNTFLHRRGRGRRCDFSTRCIQSGDGCYTVVASQCKPPPAMELAALFSLQTADLLVLASVMRAAMSGAAGIVSQISQQRSLGCLCSLVSTTIGSAESACT